MKDIALVVVLLFLSYHSFDMIDYSSFFGKKYSTIIHVIFGLSFAFFALYILKGILL